MTKLKIQWRRIVASDDLRRSAHSIAISPDRQLKIFGGELNSGELADQKVYSVDLTGKLPVSASFTGQAPRPRAASEAITCRGVMMLFSGRAGADAEPIDEHGHLWVLKDGIWRLVLAAGSEGGITPHPRWQHCMTSDGGDLVFLHGGCVKRGRFDDLWAFMLSGRRWICLRPAPGPPRSGTSIAWVKNASRLFRFGGFDGERMVGGVMDTFDVQTNRWVSRTFTADGKEGPEPRGMGCLLPLRGADRSWVVTMFGERGPSSLSSRDAGRMLGDAWAWAVDEMRWEKVEFEGDEVPAARGQFAAQSMGSEYIVLHGGLGEDNERLGDVWIGRFVVTQ